MLQLVLSMKIHDESIVLVIVSVIVPLVVKAMRSGGRLLARLE